MATNNKNNGIIDFNNTPFSNGYITFNFKEFSLNSIDLEWMNNEKNSFLAARHNCEFHLKQSNNLLSIAIHNNSDKPLFIENIQISFSADRQTRELITSEWFEYIHSFNFEGSSGVKRVGISNSYLDVNPESSMVYLIHNSEKKESYMFSTRLPYNGDYVSFKALHSHTHMEGTFGLQITSTQQRIIKPGKKIKMTTIAHSCGKKPLQLLEDLGNNYSKNKKIALKEVITGWNTWDFYAGTIKEEDIYENLKHAKKIFHDNIEYFILDEGYEPRWGIWNANWKFPNGLKNISDKITSTGKVSGIWTAPLLVDVNTDIYLNNPRWFARNENGNIVTKSFSYGTMAFLDPTNKDVRKFLTTTFTNLRKAGFTYFKVDFTQEILNATHFQDTTVPRGEIIRNAFKTIRKAIGNNNYLLACGAPFESVTGIVDACRTSGDIHNFWAHILKNASQISARWWMHRRLWNNDADFLIVRTPETISSKTTGHIHTLRPFDRKNYWKAGREMNLNEAKVYALLVYLTAGDIVLGDKLSDLNKTGIDIIKRVLKSPLQHAATPMDLFEQHDALPSIWLAEEKDYYFIGIFNWEENPKDINIDLSKYGINKSGTITGFWDDKTIEPANNIINLALRPRSCNAYIITKGE